MNPELLDNGRKLEEQVAGILNMLAGIQHDLAEIPDCPPAAEAAANLARHRATLSETVAGLAQGQTLLVRQLEQYVAALADREQALEASRAQLHALTRRLVEVQEDERRSLARDLHDTSGQALTVIGLGLSLLKREGGCSPTMTQRIDDLQHAATAVAEDLHRLSANLRPATLDHYGLAPAAEELVASLRQRTGIAVDFVVEGLEDRLPEDVETALYRIVQEACTNIARYAEAAHARVELRRAGDRVRVRVQDDGRGFDVQEALGRGRLGLVGMVERAGILGGVCRIESGTGQGTQITVEAPVRSGSVPSGSVPSGSVPSTAKAAGGEGRGDGTDPGLAPVVRPVTQASASQMAELARIKALSDAMSEITAGLSAFDNAADLLGFVLSRAAAAVACDYAVIASRQGSRWIVSHGYNLPPSMIGQRLVPAAVPLAEEIERTRDLVVVNNTEANDRLAVAARESGVFSGAGFPLIAAGVAGSPGAFLGAVAFVHNATRIAFRPSEVAFLQHLSSMISLVLAIIRLRGNG